MSEPIVYVDRSTVRPGTIDALTEAIAGLVAFIQEREPQLISYGFYLDRAASEMSVVAVHPDASSLELHLDIGGPEFRKVGAFIDLRLIEVFGAPTPAVLDRLRQKARSLGSDARVIVHDLERGFARLPGAT